MDHPLYATFGRRVGLEHAWTYFSDARKATALANSITARLGNLTIHEKKVLKAYLQDETTTQCWDRFGGPVNALARDGVLCLLERDPNPKNPIPDLYAISDIAWKHLHAHPELIDLERR